MSYEGITDRRPRAAFSGGAAPGRRSRRRRPGALLGLVVLAGAAVVGVVAAAPGSAARKKPAKRLASAGAARVVPKVATTELAAVESGLFPWQLQAPISREAVLALSPAGTVVLAGGLTTGGTSASGTYRLSTTTGSLSLLGSLTSSLHDAAYAVAGGHGFVFGGGTGVVTREVEMVTAQGAAHVTGQLPGPRADAAAVAIGDVAYVVGGYNGSAFTPDVLATSDGAHFRRVATLPVPVRYPAVVAMGGLIYVLGGEVQGGGPTDAVQLVDPATGSAKVIGRLPIAVSGAAAGVLDGTIYVAGGLGPAGRPLRRVYAFDLSRISFERAGSLMVAVANAGAVPSGGRLYVVGGETAGGAPSADVQFVRPDPAFGTAGSPGAGSPFYGDKLLIADRGNNRLLVVDSSGRTTWTYPSKTAPPPPGSFYFPDDAFFIHHGTAIISNQEENDTIVEIAYPSGRLLFSYGHAHQPGYAPGYLDNPDDAYLLRSGQIVVADPMNCRVLLIDPVSKKVLRQIGTVGACAHNPPTELGSPNGDTPLADGNILVSEINGSWVDEYTLTGRLVWAVQLPIRYPSDPQQIGPDRYLIADYESPGAIVEFNRAGQVLYRYQPRSGPGELNHPSLVEMLPSGVFMLNDDYNDRVIAIDPATGATVWQYGQTGVAGTAPGLLSSPDGFDILGPGGTTPTHPVTG
ncbi:MAG: PQQ-binding-like beta-propeller repeat protein [Acidimicrobiales bacterium]